jgi:nucleoside-diphosphate-sugar epimerase
VTRTVALTGATGFIGRALADHLENTDWRIRALVRGRRLVHTPVHRIEWVRGALEDSDSLERLVAGADAVVHCAGVARGAFESEFFRVNCDGLARLARTAAAQPTPPRFMLISSLAAREPALSPYAASKRHGEATLSAVARGMPWTVIRPPAVYGPGDREILPLLEWMARGVAPIWTSAEARFSLLYVTDLARAVIALLECATSGRIFEVHDGRPGGYSMNEVITTVERVSGRGARRLSVPAGLLATVAAANLAAARVFGYAPMLTPWKLRELAHPGWVCDNAPFSAVTGWQPRVTLEEGLRVILGKTSAQ